MLELRLNEMKWWNYIIEFISIATSSPYTHKDDERNGVFYVEASYSTMMSHGRGSFPLALATLLYCRMKGFISPLGQGRNEGISIGGSSICKFGSVWWGCNWNRIEATFPINAGWNSSIIIINVNRQAVGIHFRGTWCLCMPIEVEDNSGWVKQHT